MRPRAAATCSGVSPRCPPCSGWTPASSDAPAATSALIAFAWPLPVASCSGVFPYVMSRADGDAPAAVSASIAEAWPEAAAICSGVIPVSDVASRDAPAPIMVRVRVRVRGRGRGRGR
eukprot:scaffold30956_cov61-Phaeocystis_antarctica.AAC.7